MRVIVPLANGVEETEAITILDVLRRGGIEAVGVSIDEFGLDVEGGHKIGLVADELWDDDDVAAADMILLPGGMAGVRVLKTDSRVLDALRDFDKQGKYIGALCAAPAVLQAAGILKGRKITGYPGVESGIPDAEFHGGDSVVRDGNLITGTGPATAMEFALAVIEMLVGTDVRQTVAKALLFR